jgi:hypothetical protein
MVRGRADDLEHDQNRGDDNNDRLTDRRSELSNGYSTSGQEPSTPQQDDVR